MIKNLFRGSMDIIYNNISYTRNTVNEHIRSFDNETHEIPSFMQIAGFWRTLFELILGFYFIVSTVTALAIHFFVVIVAWPLSLCIQMFSITFSQLNNETKITNQIEPTLNESKNPK